MGQIIRACAVWIALSIIGPAWAAAQDPLPKFGHVFIVLGENHSYSQTKGSNMPYLTSLYKNTSGITGINGGLATLYWADTHPSIGNYLNLTGGKILTNDDSQTPSSSPVTGDNIAHEVQNAGKTWKDYVEDLPSVSGCGDVNSGRYIVRHNPLEYYTDIKTESPNYVCYTQLATDIKNGTLPNFGFLVPNGCDDAHDCSVGTFDNWLKTEIDPLVKSAQFQKDGLLIVVFDEDDGSGSPDCSTLTSGQGCGGQVEAVLVSPFVRNVSGGYRQQSGDPLNFNNSYEEENLLRLMAEGLGVAAYPGASSTAVNMSEFFTGATAMDFTIAATGTSTATVTAGQTASYTIALTPLGGFNQTVNLSCTGAPKLSTCTLSPTSVTLNGSSAATDMVTIMTTAPAEVRPRWPPPPLVWGSDYTALLWLLALAAVAAASRRCLRSLAVVPAEAGEHCSSPWIPSLAGMSGKGFAPAPRLRQAVRLSLAAAALAGLLAACGGSTSMTHMSGTPPGTYTITLTGTDTQVTPNLSHSTTVTLTVNP